ncbi:MAG: hypothetical protein GY937_01330 [bacterium]|nr:hypothetical protein [bacterium]
MQLKGPETCRLVVLSIAILLGLPHVAIAADRGADGKYEKRNSSHFVLYQDVAINETSGLRGSRRFEQQLLKALEGAYDRMGKRLGLRPQRPIVVVVHDAAIYDQRFGGYFRFPSAGFYGGEVHVRGDVQVHMELVQTLHHELVHAAFHAELPSLLLPAWFNEGLAEWFGARGMGRRSLTPGQARYLGAVAGEGALFYLNELSATSFAGLDPGTAQLAYIESHAFFEYLGRRFSEQKVRDVCKELVRSHDLGRAFQKTFKANLATLEAGFRSELMGSTGP